MSKKLKVFNPSKKPPSISKLSAYEELDKYINEHDCDVNLGKLTDVKLLGSSKKEEESRKDGDLNDFMEKLQLSHNVRLHQLRSAANLISLESGVDDLFSLDDISFCDSSDDEIFEPPSHITAQPTSSSSEIATMFDGGDKFSNVLRDHSRLRGTRLSQLQIDFEAGAMGRASGTRPRHVAKVSKSGQPHASSPFNDGVEVEFVLDKLSTMEQKKRSIFDKLSSLRENFENVAFDGTGTFRPPSPTAHATRRGDERGLSSLRYKDTNAHPGSDSSLSTSRGVAFGEAVASLQVKAPPLPEREDQPQTQAYTQALKKAQALRGSPTTRSRVPPCVTVAKIASPLNCRQQLGDEVPIRTPSVHVPTTPPFPPVFTPEPDHSRDGRGSGSGNNSDERNSGRGTRGPGPGPFLLPPPFEDTREREERERHRDGDRNREHALLFGADHEKDDDDDNIEEESTDEASSWRVGGGAHHSSFLYFGDDEWDLIGSGSNGR